VKEKLNFGLSIIIFLAFLVIKTITNDEFNDILYNLVLLSFEFHKTLGDIEYTIENWKDYKSKEQEKKVRELGDFL
jgi:hypothetical protein